MSIPSELVLKIAQWKDRPAAMVCDLTGDVPEKWQHALSTFRHAPAMAVSRDAELVAWLAFNYMLTHPHPKVVMLSEVGDLLANPIYDRMVEMLDTYGILGELFQSGTKRIYSKDHPESWWTVFRQWRASDSPEKQAESAMGFIAHDICMFLLDPPKLIGYAAHGCVDPLRDNGRYVLVRA